MIKREKERRKKRKKKLEETKDTSVATAPPPVQMYQPPLVAPNVAPAAPVGFAAQKTSIDNSTDDDQRLSDNNEQYSKVVKQCSGLPLQDGNPSSRVRLQLR